MLVEIERVWKQSKGACHFYYAHLNEKVLKTDQIGLFSKGQGMTLAFFLLANLNTLSQIPKIIKRWTNFFWKK